MADVASVRQAVGNWLNEEFNGVTEPEGFDYLVPGIGSTAAFVDVREIGGSHVAVTINAPVLVQVTVNGELLQYIVPVQETSCSVTCA